MLFSTLIFWLFFFVLFILYWALESGKKKVTLLLLASYIFYAYWDWKFLGLIVLVTWVAYTCGKRTFLSNDISKKKHYVKIAVITHLSVLFTFKYFDFFIYSLQDFLSLFGVESSHSTLGVILPVGISFYIFQAISYNVDVFKKNVSSFFSFKEVAFYIAFFPQLVAGPIVRASDFFPQIKTKKKLTRDCAISAVRLILIGLIYKALLADNIAPFVDQIYAQISESSNIDIVLATLGFHSQIYFDFAGYTFVAIGVAQLLGYHIPQNFNYPYLAYSITDFWRRWHISLSQWLRDYLYIPLGGNRNGKGLTYLNLLITMLLGGLWHGASWNFVIWGAIHGIALCIHKIYTEHIGEKLPKSITRNFLGLIATQYIVLMAWIFFRAETINDSFLVLRAFLNLDFLIITGGGLLLTAPLIIDHIIGRYKSHLMVLQIRNSFTLGAFLGAIYYLWLIASPFETQPFVYFQF